MTAVIVPFRRKSRPAAEESDGRVLAIAIIVTIVLIGIEAPVLLWAWRNWPAPAQQHEAPPVSAKDEVFKGDLNATFRAIQDTADRRRVVIVNIPQRLPAPHKAPQRRHSVSRRPSYQPSDHNAEGETARLNRRQTQ